MKRRDFLAIASAALAAPVLGCAGSKENSTPMVTPTAPASAAKTELVPLTPPAKGRINAAFVISEATVLIDLAGPLEVFNNVMVPDRGPSMEDQMPFRTYTVAETGKMVTAGGIKITPDFTFANCPQPNLIVIPAQSGVTPAMLDWIRDSSKTTDLTMSVCTGAFVLAKAGLLRGKDATTHHSSYKQLAMEYPDIHVRRGLRFVEAGNVATAGGLTSGIDLALRVVARYFGEKTADGTAFEMEYLGRGWQDPAVNQKYAADVSSAGKPLCPICSMETDPASAPKSVYRGKTYWFCTTAHKEIFDSAPAKWAEQ